MNSLAAWFRITPSPDNAPEERVDHPNKGPEGVQDRI